MNSPLAYSVKRQRKNYVYVRVLHEHRHEMIGTICYRIDQDHIVSFMPNDIAWSMNPDLAWQANRLTGKSIEDLAGKLDDLYTFPYIEFGW